MKTCFLTSLMFATGLALAASPASAATRPANVPAGYLATPFGYMAPECVTFLKPHETVRDRKILSRRASAARALPDCSKPRFDRRGRALKNQMLPGEHDLVASLNVQNGRGVSAASASFGQLGAPATQTGQSIIFFNALRNSASTDTNALITAVGWNMFGKGPAWTLSAMRLHANGQLTATEPEPYQSPYSPGLTPLLLISSSWSGNAVTHGPFDLFATTQAFSGSAYIFDAVSATPVDTIDALVMTTYGVESCEQLPAPGQMSVRYYVTQKPLPDLTDQVRVSQAGQTFCNMKMTSGPRDGDYGTLDISYDTSTQAAKGRTARITFTAQ